MSLCSNHCLNIWRGWHCSLSAHDPNTNAIVGLAYDAFDPDVICDEFNRIKALAADVAAELEDDDVEEEESCDNGEKNALLKKKADECPKGQHYLVFIFQSWSGKHKSAHFVAARYVLATHSSRWLRKASRHITSLLATFFIYEAGIAYDGASENRTWMNKTLNISLKVLIPELLEGENEEGENEETGVVEIEETSAEIESQEKPALDPTKRKFKENELPWDMLVAYYHPSVDGLIIMALADMSHGVKKIANSVERGNLLGLNYMPINILMLKDCYMACPDMKTNGKFIL